jgi:hypothetical protein
MVIIFNANQTDITPGKGFEGLRLFWSDNTAKYPFFFQLWFLF